MNSKNLSTNTRLRLPFRDDDSRAWALIACAVFLLRVMSWSMAEFWYDEVLTLQYFAIGGENSSLAGIFRNYVMANNHFLNSAIYWWWVRFLDFSFTEHILRWPSLFFGFASILMVVLHWRHFIGRRLAAIFGLVFAVSPVFPAFAYQVRGYSLCMFLSTLALSGVLEILHGNYRRGQIWACLACFLLPLVMPSAALLAPALALFVFWQQGNTERSWKHALSSALPCLAMTCLSASYYLSIWQQFCKAGQSAGGWESSWQVASHVILAMSCHLGLLILPFVATALFLLPRLFNASLAHKTAGLRLLLCCCLPAAAVLLLRFGGRAPFPRVFLVFLPAVSLAAASTCYYLPFIRRQKLLYLAVAVLLSGCLIEFYCKQRTVRQVKNGESPQNLLQQYYRDATDNRNAVTFIRSNDLVGENLFLVNEWDAPSFHFYWQLANLPQQAVLVSNLIPDNFWLSPQFAKFKLLVLARNEVEASSLFHKAGYKGSFHLLMKTHLRGLYSIGYGNEPQRNLSEFIKSTP
ncbi:MAG: hypothetical protein WCT05_03730 [Lentisphaeria bacterium]